MLSSPTAHDVTEPEDKDKPLVKAEPTGGFFRRRAEGK